MRLLRKSSGTVCLRDLADAAPASAGSSSLKRRELVEKNITPPGCMCASDRGEQLGVVLLHVPVVVEPLAVGERRRIDDGQVELRPAAERREIVARVGANHAVLRARRGR